MTTNNSATGGYLQPSPLAPLPGGLAFKQFVQTVFVGVSGLPGDLVRPKWQIDPPKQPDIDIDWMAIGLVVNKADTNSYNGTLPDGTNQTQRMEELEIQCAFYGPESDSLAALVRDGFQVPQNLEALRAAKMGFVSTSQMMHVPDLVNERWVDKYEMSVFMRREILRIYPILTFVSASGFVESIINSSLKSIAWNTNR